MSQSITDLLHQWGSGDPEALNQLMPVVRLRLYELAEYHLQHESIRPLQPTELLNEVYLRLTQYKHPNFRDRSHFFGAASSLIRRILVDMSRRMRSAKRDLSLLVEDFPLDSASVKGNLNIEALDAALDKMARLDARQARIVELRYFAGFSIIETAQLLDISPATVKRDWDVAKAWLKRELLK
ncbi:MAG: ECF-type sigma factor [Bryobacteraceae bacterium]